MNVFLNKAVAIAYDDYYQTPVGKRVDDLEKEAVSKILDNIQAREVLELGCGTGHWTEFLSRKGYKVLATDVSDAMLSEACKKELPDVTFQKADATKLPFPDHSFPVIFSVTMLEFTDDMEAVFNEMYRVLQPGGSLVLGCLNAASELGKAKEADEVFKYGQFLSIDLLKQYLFTFGDPFVYECVHLSPAFEILDGTPGQKGVAGVFISAFVTKEK